MRLWVFCSVWAISAGDALAILGQSAPATTAASLPAAAAAAGSGVRLQSITQAVRPSTYSVSETTLDNGTVVKEYATLAGVVFAVSWYGPVLPDLNVLLGSYAMAFELEATCARAQGRRGTPFSMDRDGLVILSGGRMRNFVGHAYAPALVPAGVTITDVLQ